MTRVVSIDAEGPGVARTALEECVAGGGVAIFPADGLYGVACDPLDAAAVDRIQQIKGREDRKPSAVMYFSPLAMRELLPSLGPRTRAAVAELLPGPVTLVVANRERRYPLACRADPERLGIRLIDGPLAGTRRPVFQTSANRSGEPPAASVEEIGVELREAVDLVVDGGRLPGTPSTVVDLGQLEEDGTWTILRAGALPPEEVASRLGTAGTG